MPPPQPGRRVSSSGRAVHEDEQRHPARPVDQVVDEVEKGVVRPVQVLEDEDERPLVRDRLEEAPPGRERLVASVPAPSSVSRPASGRRCPSIQAASAGSVTNRSTACCSFSSARSELSDSRMPACALTISPSAQNVTPSPYGSERPCRQKTTPKAPVSIAPEELEDEPALADSGDTDERDELRLALADDARKRLAQERELLRAADEPGAADSLDGDPRSCS